MITGALMRSSFSRLGDELPRLPRRRRQCLFPHPSRPGWRDHAHAEHALGRSQEIDSAGNGPPAIARLFKEAESLEPLLLFERRHIAIEPAAGDLESQQRKPVLEAIKRDEIAILRHSLLAAEITLGAEQAEGIETGDQELSFGPHHPIDLAQQLVRLVGELERV